MALGQGIRVQFRFAAVAVALAVAYAGVVASAAPTSGWGGGGGVTAAMDYADYGSAVSNNPYRSDIEQATALGLIVGHDDRTYRPGDNITLGQFANIIARNYGEQGRSESENLAFLGSLGVNTNGSTSALTVDQLLSIADAVQGMQGVADLAILGDVRNGRLVPDGSGGGITRGQAVDLLANVSGGSGGTVPVEIVEVHLAAVSGTLTPNPVRAGQQLTIAIGVSHVDTAWVVFPWGNVSPPRLSADRFEGTALVPPSVVPGEYWVTFWATNYHGDAARHDVLLKVAADPLTDIGFVITD